MLAVYYYIISNFKVLNKSSYLRRLWMVYNTKHTVNSNYQVPPYWGRDTPNGESHIVLELIEDYATCRTN